MRVWLLIGLLALAGCANAPAGDPRSETLVYPITEEQANTIIRESLLEVLPSVRPVKVVKGGWKGYQSRRWFVIDNHRIRGFYYAAKGRRPDGAIISGYRFEIRHSGSMPISGSRWARHLHAALHRRAAEVATPVPSVP